MRKPISPVSQEVVGYVSDIRAAVRSDAVIYHVTILDLRGVEHKVRMRIPPEWLRVGLPIAGRLVRVAERDTHYVLQEPRIHEELKRPRIMKTHEIHVTETSTLGERHAILHASVEGGIVSIPINSKVVLDKAKAARGVECYIHVADTPAGSIVVAVQTARQHDRDVKMEKFLRWLDKSE